MANHVAKIDPPLHPPRTSIYRVTFNPSVYYWFFINTIMGYITLQPGIMNAVVFPETVNSQE